LENTYKYQTKEASADTGLVYFGARYYNPLIGRFITPDPLGMVDGANVYLYCGNDPVNKIDFWGLLNSDPNDWDGDGFPNDHDIQPRNPDSPQPREFREDSDGDGVVDAHDIQRFNPNSPQPCSFRMDSDGDGIVDVHDIDPDNKDSPGQWPPK